MNDEREKQLIERMTPYIMEQCMQSAASQARKMAKVVPDNLSAKDALELFADAILKTNSVVWPQEGKPS